MLPRYSRLALAVVVSSTAATTHGQFVARVLYATTQNGGGQQLHILDHPSHASTTIDLSAAAFVAGSGPRWNRDASEIVFAAAQQHGNMQVWVIAPDGSGLMRVTDGGGDLVMPSFSPDGRQIAFHPVYGSLRLINADGSQAFDTGLAAGHTRWSPAGTHIVNTDWAINGYGSNVFVYDLTRRTNVQVTNQSDYEAYNYGVVSPDGLRIAVQRTTDWRTTGNYDILVMNIDGTGAINLTADMPGSDELWPAWTPDGEWIVFVSNVQSGNGTNDLWYMRANGSEKHRLTNTPDIDEQMPDVAPGFPCDADYNGDGFVNGDDYDYFVADFEEGC
ncbi:MAG: PD40 domain-containing protein [Phycisphaerales bacterium]|jgi:Tol biopolymer transport system component|nr:PD40 domain-containing protein [Phycisphaerales bacterium]